MAQDLLLRAAQYGEVDEALSLIQKEHAQPLAMPPTNTTALHAACRSGHVDMVKMLLSARADPNIKEISQCGGRAPLHVAAHANLSEITTSLLAAGALPSLQDARGSTPLHVAALAGQADVTLLLLDSRADPTVMDYAGFNAAWWAKEFKHQAVMDIYSALEVLPERRSVDVSKFKYQSGKKKKKKEAGDSKRK